MAMAAPPRRRKRRSAETRQRLVDATCHEFALRGVAGASTRSVARGADIAPSATPFHFTSEEALWPVSPST